MTAVSHQASSCLTGNFGYTATPVPGECCQTFQCLATRRAGGSPHSPGPHRMPPPFVGRMSSKERSFDDPTRRTRTTPMRRACIRPLSKSCARLGPVAHATTAAGSGTKPAGASREPCGERHRRCAVHHRARGRGRRWRCWFSLSRKSDIY